MRKGLFIFLVISFFAGFLSRVCAEEQAQGAKVSLNVFSGISSPEWLLEPDELASLKQMVAAFDEKIETEPERWPALLGTFIIWPSHEQNIPYMEVAVGVVRVKRDREEAWYKAASIEALLIRSAKRHNVDKYLDAYAPGGLEATLRPQQQKLRVGEAPTFELELRNVATEPLSLYRHVGMVIGTPGYVQVLIRAPDGTLMPILQGIVERRSPPAEAYVRFEPEKSQVHVLNANEIVGLEKLKKGKYSLYVTVHFSDEGQSVGVADAWAGSIRSNTIELNVVD